MQLARTDLGSGSRRALLVHGLAGSSASWWRIADALVDDGWRVTTIDLRGHGETGPAEDAAYRFADFASDLPGSAWDLVLGHSLAGPITITAQAQDPGFARRLALIDPVLHVPAEIRQPVGASEVADLAATAESLRAEHPTWHDRDIAAKLREAAGITPERLVAVLDANDPWDVRERLAEVDIPLLVLAGDPAVFSFTPPEHLVHAPRLTYATVEGTGHSPHRDAPERTLTMLREWLAD